MFLPKVTNLRVTFPKNVLMFPYVTRVALPVPRTRQSGDSLLCLRELGGLQWIELFPVTWGIRLSCLQLRGTQLSRLNEVEHN